MIIGVDIDGVLADYVSSFRARIIKLTGKNLFGSTTWSSWNHDLDVGYTKEESAATRRELRADPSFWFQLGMYHNTQEALDYLSLKRFYGNDVYFITDRAGVRAKQQTEAWLSARGFPCATVLISAEKGLCARALKLDVYIDDKWDNCLDVAEEPWFNELKGQWETHRSKTKTFLMDRPWNQDKHGLYISRTSTVVGIADVPAAV
jgi:5'(3')-deoxyribonucleotidase